MKVMNEFDLNVFSPFYSQLEPDFPVFIKADTDDPNVVYIEASNEALDSQKDVLVMKALESQAESFLRKGVLSWDHLHKIKNDPKYIIGEPLDVKFMKAEKRTWVKGKLYKTVEFAIKVRDLLKGGCTRLGASVGGFIKKRKSLSKAASAILQVLWDELAITYKPVNDGTLGNVSLLPMGAFAKALSAGSGVDASQFSGGRALTQESLQGAVVDVNTGSLMQELLVRIKSGDIQTPDDLRTFLSQYNALFLYDKLARILVRKFSKSEVMHGWKEKDQKFRFFSV